MKRASSGKGRSAARAARRCLAGALGWWAAAAAGGLPRLHDPSTGAVDEGDFLGGLQAYAHDIVLFGGLALCAVALLVVVKNVLSKYSQIADQRATWGEVGMHAAVGLLVVVVSVWLVTVASGILQE